MKQSKKAKLCEISETAAIPCFFQRKQITLENHKRKFVGITALFKCT